jgi:hypothetical protein
MFVCCECCVLSGRGLCDGLITRPEDFHRLWRVALCDLDCGFESRRGHGCLSVVSVVCCQGEVSATD